MKLLLMSAICSEHFEVWWKDSIGSCETIVVCGNYILCKNYKVKLSCMQGFVGRLHGSQHILQHAGLIAYMITLLFVICTSRAYSFTRRWVTIYITCKIYSSSFTREWD